MRKTKLFLTLAGLLLGLATPGWAEDTDVTSTYLKSADLSSADDWTIKFTKTDDAKEEPKLGTYTATAEGATNCFEFYAGWGNLNMSDFSMKQTVTLPAGSYKVSSYAFYRYGFAYDTDASKSCAYLVAGDVKTLLPTLGSVSLDDTYKSYANVMADASVAFGNEYYKLTVSFTLDKETTLDIGYEGTHDAAYSWFIAGPVKLYTVDESDVIKERQEVLNTYIEKAKALEGNVPTAVYDAMNVSSYESKTYTTSADINTDINTLSAAVESAEALKTNYAAWFAMYNEANTAVDATGNYTDADDAAKTLSDVLTAQYKAVEENADVTADEISTSTTTIQTAAKTFIKAVKVTGSIEITNIYMTNPSFETGDLTGWKVTTSGSDTGLQSTTNTKYAMEKSDGAWLFNTWSGSKTTLDISHEQITDLPRGKYTVKGIFGGYADASTIDLTANDVTSKLDMSDKTAATVGYENSVETEVTSAGTLDISVSNTGLGSTFFKADDFHLYYDATIVDLTITVNEATMTEYGELPTYTYTITGSDNNTYEAKDVLTTEPTFKATYTKAKNSTDYTIDVTTGSKAGTYPISVVTEAVAKDGYAVANYVTTNTLTINPVSYEDVDNLDFSADYALTEGVASYDYDTAINGTTRSGMQSVAGWEASNESTDNAHAGGVAAYGSDVWFGGTDNKVPAANPNGKASGNALAVVAVWGATSTYTKTVKLSAGPNTIKIPVYNQAGTKAIKTNLISVKVGDETKSATTTQYPVGEWTTETFRFDLDADAEATITLGYQSADSESGNGNMPHLFFDGVTISTLPIVTVKAENATATEYEGFEDKLTYTAKDKDDNDVTLKTAPTLTATASYGSTAIKGSDNGEYTITPSGAEVDGYEIVYETGKLTITEATHSEELNLELAGNPIVDGVTTYAKDRSTHNVTRSGLQPIDGWTATTNEVDESAGLKPGDQTAGGLYAIGSDAWLGGPTTGDGESAINNVAPSTAYGEETNVIGVMAVWTGTAYYTSADIDLAAGSYTLTIPVYNTSGTGTLDTNLTGIKVGESSYTAENKTYDVGRWTVETINFSVESATTGNIVLGYTSTSIGSGSAPHLFYGIPTLTPNVITRTYGYKNGTICYPYVLTPGDGTTIYEIKGRSSDSKTIYFSEAVEKTTAGKPYIYETTVTDDDNNYVATFNYDPTTKVDAEVDGTNGLYGTFEGGKVFEGLTGSPYVVQNGIWVLVPEDYRATYDKIGENKAYIKNMEDVPTVEDASSAKSMTVNFDGETTGINSATLDSENGDIYNLRGQKVNKAQKGVYIQNGRKVVIK